MRRRAALIGMLLVLGGCHSYQVIGAPPAPGQQMRARLSPAGSTWLFENFGRHRSDVEGEFLRAEPDAYVFATWRTDLPTAVRVRSSIDTLHVPRHHVLALEERRLAVGRTLLAGALAAGAVFVVARELSGSGGSGEGGDGGTRFLIQFGVAPAR